MYEFSLNWKGKFSASGETRHNPNEDMNVMIIEDIKRQIIEYCLDVEFNHNKRSKLEERLMKGLDEAKVNWIKK